MQMLLAHFNKFLKGRQRIMTEFKEEYITLRLATDQGDLLLDDEHEIGNWKLTADQDLKVRGHIIGH